MVHITWYMYMYMVHAYCIKENKYLYLRCEAGALKNFPIPYLDSNTHSVNFSESTLLSSMNGRQSKPFDWLQLNVTARRGMSAFGCKMAIPSFKSPLVNWFIFSVA